MKLQLIKKIILISIILLKSGQLIAQDQKPYKDYYPFFTTYGYIQYNDNLFSDQVLENRNGVIFSSTGYFKEHGYMRVAVGGSSGKLKDSINIEGIHFNRSERFGLTNLNINFGYKKDFWKGFQVAVFSGINFLEFSLDEGKNKFYRTKIGFPIGINLDWKYQLKKKPNIFIGAYVCNSLNYSRLFMANDKFGKSYYSYEIGLGIAYKFKEPEKNVETKKKTKKKKKRK